MKPIADSPHPGVALYRFWNTVLTAYGNDTVAFGEKGWGLKRDGRNIGYGQFYKWGVYPYFTIAPDGRFQFGGMHGEYRRSAIAKATFLDWTWTHSRYQWLVNFDLATKGQRWWDRRKDITDYEKPLHYLSEDVMGCRTWGQTRRWLILEQGAYGWKIGPARNQEAAPGKRTSKAAYDLLRASWDHYEHVVDLRYRRLRNVAEGRSTVSVAPPTVRDGKQVLNEGQAVQRLLAFLEESQPAKTTAFKRPKEAPNGNNLAPAHQL